MILLTIDTSAESASAIPTAVELANRFDDPLHALLVVDGPLRHHFDELARERGTDSETEIAAYLADVRSKLADAGRPDAIVSHRQAVDAGTAIVEATREPDVDLVVMATHGRSGLSRLLAGSVAEHIIRNSDVPVVVVPARSTG